MKLYAYIMVVLLAKTVVTTALCQMHCMAETSHCEMAQVSDLCSGDTKELPCQSTDQSGQCHCPGCHVLLMPAGVLEGMEVSEDHPSSEFTWIQKFYPSHASSVFHPPCV